MPKSPIAIAAGAALLLAPMALLAAPAEASHQGIVIKTCAKTQHGTQVRVRLRFFDDKLKVRVSHPRGENRFESRKVRSVSTHIGGGGKAPPPDENGGQVGGGAWFERFGDRPVIVTDSGYYNHVSVRFKLVNGKTIRLGCSQTLS